MNELSYAISQLTPDIRLIVLELANSVAPVTRRQAYAALLDLPPTLRKHITLDRGKIAVSDLANKVRIVRIRRSKAIRQIYPFIEHCGRPIYIKMLPFKERLRLKNRNSVIEAADRAMPSALRPSSGWLVYAADDANVGYQPHAFGNGLYFKTMHTIKIPHLWRSQVDGIGDGSGCLAERLILRTKMIGCSPCGSMRIYEALVARALDNEMIINETVYICANHCGNDKIYPFSSDALRKLHPNINFGAQNTRTQPWNVECRAA